MKENQKLNHPMGNLHSLLYVSLDSFEGQKLFNFIDFGILENDMIKFAKFDEFSNYDWGQHIKIHESLKIMIK